MGFTAMLAIGYTALLLADAVALAKRQWAAAVLLTAVMAAGLIALWVLWSNSPM